MCKRETKYFLIFFNVSPSGRDSNMFFVYNFDIFLTYPTLFSLGNGGEQFRFFCISLFQQLLCYRLAWSLTNSTCPLFQDKAAADAVAGIRGVYNTRYVIGSSTNVLCMISSLIPFSSPSWVEGVWKSQITLL